MAVRGRALAMFVAAGAGIIVPPVVAQSLTQTSRPLQLLPWAQIAPEEHAEAEPMTGQPALADPMQDVDVSKLDWSQLSLDGPVTSGADAKLRSGKPGAVAGGSDLNWSNRNNRDGSAGVSVKQSVSPFWDTRVGADMTVTRQATTMSELLAEKAENRGTLPQNGGTAWAALTAPGAGSIWDKTALEARVDPNADQSRIGATITKAVPLIDEYQLSLQNGYKVTQQGMVPLPGAAPRTNRSFDTDQSAKLSMGSFGTTLIAGQTLSSSEDKWLRHLGAEQKLSNNIVLSGSIGETAQGITSKSITAGFKKSW